MSSAKVIIARVELDFGFSPDWLTLQFDENKIYTLPGFHPVSKKIKDFKTYSELGTDPMVDN